MSLIEASFRRALRTIKEQPAIAVLTLVVYSGLSYIQVVQPPVDETEELSTIGVPLIMAGFGIALTVISFLLIQVAIKSKQPLGLQFRKAVGRIPALLRKGIQVFALFVVVFGLLTGVIVPAVVTVNPILIGGAVLATLVFIVALIYLSIFGGFMSYLFTEEKQLNLLQTLRMSERMVRDNFVQLFILALIIGGIAFVFGIASGIGGMLAAMPEMESQVASDAEIVSVTLPGSFAVIIAILGGLLSIAQAYITAAVFYTIREGGERSL